MTRKGREDRTVELLGELQLGRCAACGSARYGSRRQARYAARIASPGMRLRSHRCGGFWHLRAFTALAEDGRPSTPSGPLQARAIAGLDARAGVERVYGRRRCPAGHHDRKGRPWHPDGAEYPDEGVADRPERCCRFARSGVSDSAPRKRRPGG